MCEGLLPDIIKLSQDEEVEALEAARETAVTWKNVSVWLDIDKGNPGYVLSEEEITTSILLDQPHQEK